MSLLLECPLPSGKHTPLNSVRELGSMGEEEGDTRGDLEAFAWMRFSRDNSLTYQGCVQRATGSCGALNKRLHLSELPSPMDLLAGPQNKCAVK
jgi:hypothetical protein